jgi:phosphatidylinositol alpha-mannosyltransferase
VRLAFTHAFCWPEVQRGGERLLHELAGAMARRGHTVTILSSASTRRTSVEDGVRVVRLRHPAVTDKMTEEHWFGKHVFWPLLRGRYDVVHSLGIDDAAASIVAARVHPRRRTVLTHLGIPSREHYQDDPDFHWHEFVARHIDVFGCMSRYAARTLETDYGRAAALTPGGVHLERFAVSRRRSEHPTLFYSGALTEPRKHLDDLLAALAILAVDVPEVRLRLAGSGDPTALIAAAPPAARDRVDVVPNASPELSALYGEAWATVLPSEYEAFGIVLVESLACGTPIVVCDHAAPPELAQPGVGVVAPPRDPAALADACRRAFDLVREPGIEQRCRAAAAPYDWDTGVAPAVEALYTG